VLGLCNAALITCFLFVLKIHTRQVCKEDSGLMSSNNLRIIFIMILHIHTLSTLVCRPFDQNCIWEHFFPMLMPNYKVYTMNGEKEGLKSTMTENKFILSTLSSLSKFHSSYCGFFKVTVLCLCCMCVWRCCEAVWLSAKCSWYHYCLLFKSIQKHQPICFPNSFCNNMM